MLKEFSVVISVYSKDDPVHFSMAIDSLFRQTVLPNEIIVAVDGPVDGELLQRVNQYSQIPKISVIRLPQNIGLGASRHKAILQAKSEIIAVMDSDDVCTENRFALQIERFNSVSIDIVGGYIAEFSESPDLVKSIREVPLSHEAIVRRGRWRQPINHVTLMFRKEAYFLSGGYRSFRKIEDYDLFHRMVMTGSIFLNLPEIIVKVRASDNQYARRHGVAYLREEIILFRGMLISGYIGNIQFLLNISSRFFGRLMPLFALRFLSKKLFRKSYLNN